MAAKFEISSPKAGEFRWVLTSQGRTLAASESYTRKASAEKAIESFRKGAATAQVVDATLAPPKTAPGKAARTSGRAAGKAVVKSARAVDKAQKTAAKTATKATKAARKATAKAAKTVKKATNKATAKSSTKATAPRQRTSRTR